MVLLHDRGSIIRQDFIKGTTGFNYGNWVISYTLTLFFSHIRNLSVSLIITALILIFSAFPASRACAGTFTPDQVKAAMLIKFTSFINWPERAFKEDPEDFVIGVLGRPGLFNLLKPLEGKKIKGRSLRVILLKSWTPQDSLHIVYLNHYPEQSRSRAKGDAPFPTLTVSDSKDFLQSGGILRFITRKNGKIGFAVNREAQLRSGLDFSTSLLKLAKIKKFKQGG